MLKTIYQNLSTENYYYIGLIRCRYLFFDGVVFDTLEKTIQNKQDILYQLSNIKYKILVLLTENVYSLVNCDKFFHAVYNRPYDGYSRSIDVTQ